jgi:hypothetical protein
MTTMMIDNSDILLNFNNNPSPLVAFNNIMRKYYDSNGNPIQQRKRNNVTNQNREIVSSVQPITKETKKDTLTLDLLLAKRSCYVITKDGARKAGEEILASTAPLTDSKKDFDLRDFMNHYSREQQTRDRNIHSTTSSNKLTLADLQNARQRQTRTYIKSKKDDY